MTARVTGYGRGAAAIAEAPVPKDINGVPTGNTTYSFGQLIYNYATGNWYIYSGNSTFPLLTTSSGNIASIVGTANEVTSSTVSGVATLSIPSTFTSPGSVTAAAGNLVASAAGGKLVIHATTAASDSVGTTAAMSGSPGAVTVASTAVTTASVILFSRATTGGTPGQVSITAQSAGSFTLTSTGNETSTFNYLIIN